MTMQVNKMILSYTVVSTAAPPQ